MQHVQAWHLKEVMRMRIEQGWKLKKLKDLEAGDIFYLCGSILIKTDNRSEDKDAHVCVELMSGMLTNISINENVGVIKDAVLKLGGYYNHD